MPKNINALINGYKKFRTHYFNDDSGVFKKLVRHGQHPKVLMVACSDSRVDPAIIMNCEPGDLFVVRNVANLVPPYQADDSHHGTSAALEFAVCNLKIRHVIVFGHSQCGGIHALVENADVSHPSYSFVAKWMELAQSACDLTYKNHPNAPIEEKAHHCGHYAIINSLNNLMTFPWIADGVQQGTLFIHGWFFDLLTGSINACNLKTGKFEELGTSVEVS